MFIRVKLDTTTKSLNYCNWWHWFKTRTNPKWKVENPDQFDENIDKQSREDVATNKEEAEVVH